MMIKQLNHRCLLLLLGLFFIQFLLIKYTEEMVVSTTWFGWVLNLEFFFIVASWLYLLKCTFVDVDWGNFVYGWILVSASIFILIVSLASDFYSDRFADGVDYLFFGLYFPFSLAGLPIVALIDWFFTTYVPNFYGTFVGKFLVWEISSLLFLIFSFVFSNFLLKQRSPSRND